MWWCGAFVGLLLLGGDDNKAVIPNITLVETQDGVAGPEGFIWHIESSGNWFVSRHVSKGPIPPAHRRGRLTFPKKDWKNLVSYLELKDFSNLPATFEHNTVLVNSHEFSICFNGEIKRLILGPGMTLEEAELFFAKADTKDGEIIDRFAAIIKTIKSVAAD